MPYVHKQIPKHTKIYLKSFGYDLGDAGQFFESELSGNRAVDVHHIIGRGKGGEDRIENLMALTRAEHNYYGDKKKYMWMLLAHHRSELRRHNIEFDNNWFEEKMSLYAYETAN